MKIQTLENGCCGRKHWRDNIRMSTQWCEAWLGLSTETLRRGKTMVWVHRSDNFSKTKFCLAAEIGTNPTTVSRCDDGQTTTVWCLNRSPPPPPPPPQPASSLLSYAFRFSSSDFFLSYPPLASPWGGPSPPACPSVYDRCLCGYSVACASSLLPLCVQFVRNKTHNRLSQYI